MTALKRYFDIRNEVAELIRAQNQLVKHHYFELKHVTHCHIWIEPEDISNEQGTGDVDHKIQKKPMEYFLDDDSSYDSVV